MSDNRGEAYLQNPLSKMTILLKRLPNGAVILTFVYLYNSFKVCYLQKIKMQVHRKFFSNI